MTPDDLAILKARIETALAESVKELGGAAVPKPRLTRLAMPMDRAWALVNHDDTRAILTDHAARAMGGDAFTVTVNDEGIVIEAAGSPKVSPPAKPKEGVTVPADGVAREAHLG